MVTKRPIGEELTRELFCPITKELMEEPVIAADGNTYELKAMAQWLNAHNTSPLTNVALDCKTLFLNLAVKRILNKMKESSK